MNFDFVTGELLLRATLPAAAAVVVCTGLARRRPGTALLPVGGVIWVALAWFAFAGSGEFGVRIWSGAALAGLGSFVGSRVWVPVHVALVVPGVVLAVSSVPPDVAGWMQALAVVAVALNGAGTDRFERSQPHSTVPLVMVMGSVCATFLTVPETDAYSGLLLLSVPFLVAGWPVPSLRLGPGGGSAILTVTAVLTIEAGYARDGAIIGGLLVGGVLLLGLAPRLADVLSGPSWSSIAWRYVLVHAAITFWMVRIAGLRDGVVAASLLALVGHAALAATMGRLLRALPFER